MLTHPRQELYRLGILFHGQDTAQDESNSVAREVPAQQSAPIFVIRPSRPIRRTRRSTWQSLSLYLSLSDLSSDVDIARLLCPPISHTPAIQHHDISPIPIITDIPQSLPPPPALESMHGPLLDNIISSSSPHYDFNSGDWTFIDAAYHTPQISTPSSEPEAWILLSDDS
jgi:hypothetical protein